MPIDVIVNLKVELGDHCEKRKEEKTHPLS